LLCPQEVEDDEDDDDRPDDVDQVPLAHDCPPVVFARLPRH
jgi:hypothetical protein